ncbi:hypothetical protein SBA1_1220004 [Candidatus Sulfotelmatobacter kueseliae]|uniref:Uncharacterized protein n=1 Tax=Candidatus Sulfotelmatobacter kueseliae TaxID=2042962 RepID=A0A2U3K3R8_9BACT|nr:hypothetical protein SBA1_1220004 [Candidatus Sulfotelmatobacter kueseliae]
MTQQLRIQHDEDSTQPWKSGPSEPALSKRSAPKGPRQPAKFSITRIACTTVEERRFSAASGAPKRSGL